VDARGEQRGPRPSMPGNQAIDTLALRRISIPSRRRWSKPTFINMNRLFTATEESLAQAEEPSALPRVAFLVADPFFYGSPAVVGAHAKYNDGRPGNVAPAPLVSYRDGLPHDGARLPNPVCGVVVGRGACTPRPRA
jgi:hypothetical protein